MVVPEQALGPTPGVQLYKHTCPRTGDGPYARCSTVQTHLFHVRCTAQTRLFQNRRWALRQVFSCTNPPVPRQVYSTNPPVPEQALGPTLGVQLYNPTPTPHPPTPVPRLTTMAILHGTIWRACLFKQSSPSTSASTVWAAAAVLIACHKKRMAGDPVVSSESRDPTFSAQPRRMARRIMKVDGKGTAGSGGRGGEREGLGGGGVLQSSGAIHIQAHAAEN